MHRVYLGLVFLLSLLLADIGMADSQYTKLFFHSCKFLPNSSNKLSYGASVALGCFQPKEGSETRGLDMFLSA